MAMLNFNPKGMETRLKLPTAKRLKLPAAVTTQGCNATLSVILGVWSTWPGGNKDRKEISTLKRKILSHHLVRIS